MFYIYLNRRVFVMDLALYFMYDPKTHFLIMLFSFILG